MMGGSGSGKSYVRNIRYAGMTTLDCDDIKTTHPDYDPKNPQDLHAWSASELKRAFFATTATGESFVYDGTGSTAERYVNYITHAQEMGYEVEVCYVTVPLTVALKRNRDVADFNFVAHFLSVSDVCLLYTSPSPRDS